MRQDPAAQVRTEFALHVRGEGPVVLLAGFGEERLEVLGDQLVEQRLFGLVALVYTGNRHGERSGGRPTTEARSERHAGQRRRWWRCNCPYRGWRDQDPPWRIAGG
jgi:hypothetical protein